VGISGFDTAAGDYVGDQLYLVIGILAMWAKA